MEIGPRIRQLRIRNDLTLEELAGRCELSKGFLSQLERDLTSPSVSTLEDIVEALGSTMSEFFREEEDEKIVFDDQEQFVKNSDGSRTVWIIPNAQKNRMEPILLELEPGKQSEVVQPHEGEEFGYVLQGNLTLHLGKQILKLHKGSSFSLSGEKEHYLSNDSSKNAKIIWVCSPPIF